jgi:hypothetical protein
VKFTCDRCGKKYATADAPSPGRVYKIKCKACGHAIVVRAAPASSPEVPLEVAPPEPAAPQQEAAVHPPPIPASLDGTQEVSVAALGAPEEVRPASGDGGYVDLFADGPKQDPPPEPTPTAPTLEPIAVSPIAVEPARTPAPADDPFIAAAQASLPDGFGAGSRTPDPFPRAAAKPPPTPKIPVIPKAPQQRSALPLVLIGAGGVVLVGILAFVLLGKGPAPAPAPEKAKAPVAAAASPAPAAPQPAPAPPPAVTAAQAAQAAAADEARAREERIARERAEKEAREREAKEAREREAREAREQREREKASREARAREEREAKERDRIAREQKAREERELRERDEEEARDRELRDRQRREREKLAAMAAASTSDGEGLSQQTIDKVVASARKMFDDCMATQAGDVRLDGRKVMLTLNIQNTGAVTYPTLDDVTLSSTPLGSCLKSAAKNMVFPQFKGDTIQAEVPVALARR